MAVQLCTAHHPDAPPRALGGLKLCMGHLRRLVEALTGPSAAEDPTLDCTWGVRAWGGVAMYDNRGDADRAYSTASDRWWILTGQHRLSPDMPMPKLVVHNGADWCYPAEFRPGTLVRAWAALEGQTSPRTASAAHVSGTAEPPLPINPAVAALRDRIPGVLASWARIHVEEMATTPPAARDPATVSAWLARYTDWSAAQPFASEYVRELTELLGRGRHIIDLPKPRRTQVGPCPQRVNGQRCTGLLWSNIREERDPKPSEVMCDACGKIWDSTQWLRLGQRVDTIRKPAA